MELLLVEEVAKLLRVSRSTAYGMAQRREFPVIVMGRCVRVPKDDFMRWLRGQVREPER